MKARDFLFRFNWISFAATLALVAAGTVAIWSAGNARSLAAFHTMWLGNLWTALFGLAVYAVLALVDYRKTLDFLAAPGYFAAVVFLVLVLAVGSTVYAGRRWLWFFQPSEVAKLAVIALFAWLFGRGVRTFFSRMPVLALPAALALAAVPLVLILLEPDLGTALTLVPALFAMLVVSGVGRKALLTLALALGVLALAVLGAVYEATRPGVGAERREAILRCVPLRPHQVKRVKVFLFPEADPMGSGYNLRQAKIAIGSGGMTGKGIGRGEANHLKYLPPSVSMNDFIFCVWAEETGYLGSLVLLALYGALLLSGAWTAFRAEDGRGRALALGVSTLLFAHVWTNVAMSIGLVPITGLPLPFISSGRTFLLTVMTALGLVQSVALHPGPEEKQSIFTENV